MKENKKNTHFSKKEELIINFSTRRHQHIIRTETNLYLDLVFFFFFCRFFFNYYKCEPYCFFYKPIKNISFVYTHLCNLTDFTLIKIFRNCNFFGQNRKKITVNMNMNNTLNFIAALLASQPSKQENLLVSAAPLEQAVNL